MDENSFATIEVRHDGISVSLHNADKDTKMKLRTPIVTSNELQFQAIIVATFLGLRADTFAESLRRISNWDQVKAEFDNNGEVDI